MRNLVCSALISAAALLCASLNGCSSEKKASKPVVAVSTGPQAFLFDRLAPGLVDVVVTVPPVVHPGAYEPSVSQMLELSRAVLYFKIGHPKFPPEGEFLSRLSADKPEMKVVDGSRGVSFLEDDPNVWTSPKSAAVMAKNAAATLRELLPASSAAISANEAKLLRELEALSEECKAALAGGKRNVFYSFHPAWGYLAREFGLVEKSIEQGHKEPSLPDIIRIAGEAKALGIKTIFLQPGQAEQSAQAEAAELGGSVAPLDALSRDYLTSMRAACTAIGKALRE